MPKTVLVVAAHSDDEALGCGGTIAKHAAAGDEVHVLFLTDGVGARGDDDKVAIDERESTAQTAAKILGIHSVTQLDFPDNRIDSVPLLEVVQKVETMALRLQPNIVYTHNRSDLNVDHRLCHQAVLTAFRPMPETQTREILCFEVLSSTEWAFDTSSVFKPRVYVDITTTLETKIKALEAYTSEMRSFPHARSIDAVRALAMYRGASVGCSACEAFELVRSSR